ncbi:short-chain alcohol dehydrogenase like protein [Saccharomonospora cyanea NA-134]|uniref:Short-chain alcohol dehydrogenase like protein n=2 Tax=Saccharomonospora cyanea TaxID=40989 RepID=H5XK96_9PSEU|nr:short-chain alcohol dehydrogenase like protein [Saccharomonospora cyanea NA-134]
MSRLVAMNEHSAHSAGVALVTGGSRGIGAATALRLASDGFDVAITYRNGEDKAREVVHAVEATGRRALAVQADSGEPGAIEAAVARTVNVLGGIDVLVNNAGEFLVAPLDELTLDDFDRTMAVNVRAPFAAAKAALEHMRDGGRIVSIGSNVAERAVFPGFSLYSASKAALVGLAKGLGRELGPRGITVNVVHPGPTDTDTNPASGPNAEAINSFTALGRYASPGEIAAAVSFLAGDGGRYVTGTAISVDGGFSA